jgi:hypothetical protein
MIHFSHVVSHFVTPRDASAQKGIPYFDNTNVRKQKISCERAWELSRTRTHDSFHTGTRRSALRAERTLR